jgi:hypothetical protein
LGSIWVIGRAEGLAVLGDACGFHAHACTPFIAAESNWLYSIIVGNGRSYAASTPISTVCWGGVLQLIGHQQVADRGHIRATQFQSLTDTGFQLRVPWSFSVMLHSIATHTPV